VTAKECICVAGRNLGPATVAHRSVGPRRRPPTLISRKICFANIFNLPRGRDILQSMASVYKSLSKASGDPRAKAEKIGTHKQRVLILSSRGVTYRHRHLLNDLYSLLPHSRKDAKLDTKTKPYQLNELADLYNCNNVLFFEARKGKDLYLWMSKAPNG
jgi:hypothetical protein